MAQTNCFFPVLLTLTWRSTRGQVPLCHNPGCDGATRACSPTQAPPGPAAPDSSERQSSARAISRNAPPGRKARTRPAATLLGGNGRIRAHGSVLAVRPNVAWGTTADPEGSCGTRPGGDPSWRCSTAQARWQLMRHSGRRTRSPKFTGHCPGSGRPLGSINQTQSPHVH